MINPTGSTGLRRVLRCEFLESEGGPSVTRKDELIQGNIDVVDRVSIGDVERLKENPKIGVRPYALPTVHLLIPKIRSEELGEDLYFRSGLSHLIDRNLVVNDVICNGNLIDGCTPISGPFPLGTADNDQISYGYDVKSVSYTHLTLPTICSV